MFSVADRSRLSDELVTAARSDPRIVAAAIVGSLATGPGDQWSDIDLALRLAPDLAPLEVIESWTSAMYERHHAVSHVDVWSGPTLFRVFLLINSMQVDLSLWPNPDFAQNGGPFELIFGESNSARPQSLQSTASVTGVAWLYALHARSSIARGRGLQALHMLNGMREQIISLACLREGLPPDHGRGADQLPNPIKQQLMATIVRSIESEELVRVFTLLIDALLLEVKAVDRDTANRLRPTLRELIRASRDDG